jgi:tRNA (guanine37-N1)-methyltransferase
MLMRVDIIDLALQDLKRKVKTEKVRTILLDATGEKYTQGKAQELSKLDHIILIAGHYEGVDHRVHEYLVDEVISIGDYVLTGGEIPSMVLVDSVIRLIPGVLGKDESSVDESHKVPGYLEYPQYTRPEDYKDWKVPKILLSGNHAEIDKWRKLK